MGNVGGVDEYIFTVFVLFLFMQSNFLRSKHKIAWQVNVYGNFVKGKKKIETLIHIFCYFCGINPAFLI